MNLNNFGPFEPKLWGNVSEWVLILIVAITAYFIWRILRSQLKVQQLQQKYMEIEIYNHKYRIIPKFTLNIDPFKPRIFEDNLQFNKVPITFSLNHNVATNITIQADRLNTPGLLEFIGLNSYEFINMEDKFTIYLNFRQKILNKITDSPPEYWIEIDFTLTFQDVDGNKYEQLCHATFANWNIYSASDNPVAL